MDHSSTGNIQNHYQCIGNTLLDLEPYTSLYSYILRRPPEAFRENLSFVPIEVLESYLEDLLDFTISDENLHIYRRHSGKKYDLIAIAGLALAVVYGLKLAYSGASLFLAIAAVLLISIPSGVIWHLSPKMSPNRRLFFARLLSQEISRRKGDDGGMNLMTRISDKFIKPPAKTVPSVSRIPVSRRRIH